MISIQAHISKLEVLNKYMEVKVEDMYYREKNANLRAVAYLFFGTNLPLPPFPNFETWYQLYCATNN